jgi:hypothetical protein
MRTVILKRAWRAFGQAPFIPQSRGVIVMAALLLAAANLFAIPTGVNVTTLGGGNPHVNPKYLGYEDGITLNQALFHTPCGLALDSTGQYLFVADRDNSAIRYLDLVAGWTWTFGVTYTNLINKPIAVAVDTDYNVYVLNRGNVTNGSVVTFDNWGDAWATNAVRLTNAAGMALDSAGNIYVTVQSNKLIRIAAGTTNRTTIATIPNAGTSLQGIVVKHNGLIAACDSGRNGIYLINPATGVVTTNAGFHGTGDFTTNGNNIASSTTAKFNQPMCVAEAGDGTLIVTDYGNNRVKAVLTSGVVTNLYGVTSKYWGGSYPGWYDGTVSVPDSIAPNVQSRLPFGVVMAPDGSLYTTEVYYHIIRKVTGASLAPPPPPSPAPPAGLTATAGYGQVILMWVTSPGATNYNIKHAMSSGGPYTTITNTGGTITSYTDTNVIDGTMNYFVVSALNIGGESANSAEASAMPLFSPAPTILLPVTNYNFGPIILTWTTSAGATSYNVKRSTSTGTETTIANTASTSYTDTNVLNGTTYYYVISALNGGGEGTNSLEVSYTPPIPPPPAPRIGWFDVELDTSSDRFWTVLHPVSILVFNNDVNIAIDPTVAGVNTYYTVDSSVPSVTNEFSPPAYRDHDYDYSSDLPLNVTIVPDLVIKAVNVNGGTNGVRGPVTTAEFLFQVGNPTINGNNGAQFTVSDITTNVALWYTIDGTVPTNAPPSIWGGTITNGLPVTLSIAMSSTSSNILFQARAFRSGYLPSGIASQTFTAANYLPNTISFGFASGEASSDFVASPGQFFYAPVTLTTMPSVVIYSLQFNITVTNLGPIAVPGLFWFTSMLEKPDPANPGFFLDIPTWAFVSSGTNPPPASDIDVFRYQGDWYQDLQFINGNLLGVGWIERYGATNLYITKSQDLITYSRAHDVMYPNAAYPDEVELGAYGLLIPRAATTNDVYQIQIGRPSATSDGVGAPGSDVYIAAPTNGSTAGGSPINALKNITIGQRKYIVGSVYPFRWFNAGDFGSSNIVNADVEQVFEAAAYGLNGPLDGSDFFDGMDSCGNIGVLDSDPADANNGYYTNTFAYPTRPPVFTYSVTYTAIDYDTNGVPISTNVTPVTVWQPLYLTTYYVNEVSTIAYIQPSTSIPPAYSTNLVFVTNTVYFPTIPASLNTLFDGDDTAINQIAFGDGVLDVCDVYVTFRRSLDPSLTWFRRFWNNGQRVADTGAPNVAAHAASKILITSKSLSAQSAAQSSATTLPQVNFTAGDIVGSAGRTVQIPINATIFGNYPLRVLMLNLNVTPLDGSPALTSAVQFTPNAALGDPYTTDSKGNGNSSAVWLDNTISGLTGTANIGTLTVTIPTNTTSLSAYAIHFDHASASPNGIASFPKQTLTGVITLSSRTNSSYGDGIPDLWRLRWFGTVNNLLSVSNACPSGDGINNWQKYVAGVDPNTPNDFPSLNCKTPVPAGATAAIHWPTVSGKQYVILSSSSLFPGSWSAIATNTGTGTDMEFDDTTTSQTRFYRVQILR